MGLLLILAVLAFKYSKHAHGLIILAGGRHLTTKLLPWAEASHDEPILREVIENVVDHVRVYGVSFLDYRERGAKYVPLRLRWPIDIELRLR